MEVKFYIIAYKVTISDRKWKVWKVTYVSRQTAKKYGEDFFNSVYKWRIVCVKFTSGK